MSQARMFVGTRLRQLSDVTGGLQDWLRKLADRIEKPQDGTAPHSARSRWSRRRSWRGRSVVRLPLRGGIGGRRCERARRIGSIALTAQQQEAARQVGEQVRAVNRQVSAMRDARRKEHGHGPADPRQ